MSILNQLNFDIVLLFFVIGVNTLLAFFVFQNNPRSSTNRVFGMLSFVTSFWLFTMYVSSRGVDIYNQLLWMRLSIFFAVPQAVLFYFLAKTLPSGKLEMKETPLILIFTATIFVMALTLSPLVFADMVIINGSPAPLIGPAISIFSITVVVFSFLALFTLVRKISSSRGIARQQLKFVFYGMITMLGLIIATILIPVAVFNNSFFVSFAPLYTFIFLGATAYAIVRHRLLDIRTLVARSVAYTIFVIIIGLAYSGSIVLASQYFLGYSIGMSNVMLLTIVTLIVAYSYNPLLRKVEKFTDRIFYKDRYDSHELLRKVGKVASSTLELEELAELIIVIMLRSMKISTGHLVLVKQHQVIWQFGTDHHQKLKHPIQDKDVFELIQGAIHRRGDNILLVDEMAEGSLKTLMKEYKISVLYPLQVEKKTIGMMYFSEKLNGEIFSTEDIHMFNIISSEIAVAIKNSLQYEEIKKFNITLKQQVEEATRDLRHANQQLKALDKMKDDFVSVASHELRTPMTAIKSYLWMAMAGKGGKISDKLKFYLGRAYTSTDRLIKLVNDMLNISRIESGRITIELDKVDLVALTQEIIDEIKPRVDELKLTIKLNKKTDEGSQVDHVLADPDKIKEVIFNLIGNSLKFTDPGGIIEVSFKKEGTHIITFVKDDGRGIDESDMETLFTKFGMLPGSYATNKKASGTGLGLYISKSIIEIQKGKMGVSSEGVGKGSTFWFSLPVFMPSDKKRISADKNDKLGIIHSGF